MRSDLRKVVSEFLSEEREWRARIDQGAALVNTELFSGVNLSTSVAWHPSKKISAQLSAAGVHVVPRLEEIGLRPLVVTFLGAQRVENEYLIAESLLHTGAGGRSLFALENSIGAKRFERYLKDVAFRVESYSARKCRLFWTEADSQGSVIADAETVAKWRLSGTVQRNPVTGFWSCPGLFSWNEIDAGSAFLVEHLPELTGKGADFGSGYGYLSAKILASSPSDTSITLFDIDSRAIECARRNLESYGARVSYEWADVTKDVKPSSYDWVVMNPPFHVGSKESVSLGAAVVRAGANALRRGGSIFLVANRSLPYEKDLQGALGNFQELAQSSNFKVLSATR